MIPVFSMASSGSYARAHRGATCPKAWGRILPPTIASSAGIVGEFVAHEVKLHFKGLKSFSAISDDSLKRGSEFGMCILCLIVYLKPQDIVP